MKTILRSALAVAVLIGMAAPAAAQMVKLNPRAGIYVPLTDLGDAGSTFGTIAADRSGTLAYGLGVEIDFPVFPLDVRANLDYATGSEITLEGTGGTTDRELMMLSADVMFRPLPSLIIVKPYFFAGAGVRKYDFDAASLEDASDPMFHGGGGLELLLGPLTVNGEVGDYISSYEDPTGTSQTQHDVFVTIGLVLGLL